MDMKVIDIIVVVLCIIGYAVMVYFKVRGDVIGAVSELIAAAEATGLAGSDKMAQVVSQLAELVPAPFKTVLTQSVLQKIAQKVFDWMREYANNYIEAKKEKDSEEQKKKLYEENAETTAAILAELMKLSRDALLKKAAEQYGIEFESTATNDEIIKAIVLEALKRA